MHTVQEIAEYLGCSDMHVYRLIAAGELRTVDIGGPDAKRPKIRIRSDDLADYINRKTSGAKRPA
jgi:excisionase family DNA binding protein